MALEGDIVAALTALGVFASVNYIVTEAGDAEIPEVLPWAVLQDNGREFSEFATMCSSESYQQGFVLTITAQTAEAARALSTQAVTALDGLAYLESAEDTYNAELRAFQCDIVLLSLLITA